MTRPALEGEPGPFGQSEDAIGLIEKASGSIRFYPDVSWQPGGAYFNLRRY